MKKCIKKVCNIITYIIVISIIIFIARTILIENTKVCVNYKASNEGKIRLYYNADNGQGYPFSDDVATEIDVYKTNEGYDTAITNVDARRMIDFRIDSVRVNELIIHSIDLKFLGFSIMHLDSAQINEKIAAVYDASAELKGDIISVKTDQPRGIVELRDIDVAHCVQVINIISVILGVFIGTFACKILFIQFKSVDSSYRKHYVFLGIFLGMLIIPNVLVSFIGIEGNKSVENRSLQEKPKLNLRELNTYASKYEAYYLDNLPLKGKLVALNSLIKYEVFKISPIKSVIKGKDGWLFYNSRYKNDGDVVQDYQGLGYYSQEELEKIASKLIDKRDYLSSQGIGFVFMICPNKSRIYPEYMPDYINKINETSRAEQLVEYLRNNTDLNIVYPKEELVEARKSITYPLYYKQDTHWNLLGGYIGANSLMRRINELEGIGELESIESLRIDKESELIRTGDLLQFLNLGKFAGEENYFIKNYKEDIVVHNIESNESNVLRYNSSNTNQKKIVMFRDSFTTSMIPYLQKEFEDSIFVWDHTFNKELIEAEKPNVVVWEVVERNKTALLDY